MNRKPDNFTLINRYLNEELSETEARELENEMESNPGLRAELNFHLEVEDAIQEKEIASLRENMNNIISQNKPVAIEEEYVMSDSYSFGSTEELDNIHNLKNRMKLDDIINFNHSFPKIHLYQHILAAKENIYQFYKEQQEQSYKKDFELQSPIDDLLFEDIKDALIEDDVLDLRANLKQIASSISLHSYSPEDIHDFVDGIMDEEQRCRFEEDIKFDKNLENEIRLYQDVDFALAENDIMDLRASLQEIRESSQKFTSGIEEIEGYIYNELSESQMAIFEDELIRNKELHAEIELIKDIDQSIQEKDIMQLRGNLRKIANDNIHEKQNEQSIAGRFWYRKTAISVIAASLILLLAITGLMRYTNDDNLYHKFYTKYETAGISRSANSMPDLNMALALQKYNDQDYESALNLLQEVVSKDQSNMAGHFYSAVSLQELGKYKNAIEEYKVVVVDKDNLFTEQAEWYIGLCYLQTNDDKKALQQFKKIANGKGFYQQRAVAILEKLKNNI